MRMHLSSGLLSVIMMPCVIALAGCHGREYYAERLNAIPVPQPALMQSLPDPDCRVPIHAAAKRDETGQGGPRSAEGKRPKGGERRNADASEKAPQKSADRTNERIDPSDASHDTSAGSSKPAAKPAIPERGDAVEQLRKERDCYRRAEQRARARLRRLQASTAGTIGALREAKRTLRSPMRLHASRSDDLEPAADGPALALGRLDDAKR